MDRRVGCRWRARVAKGRRVGVGVDDRQVRTKGICSVKKSIPAERGLSLSLLLLLPLVAPSPPLEWTKPGFPGAGNEEARERSPAARRVGFGGGRRRGRVRAKAKAKRGGARRGSASRYCRLRPRSMTSGLREGDDQGERGLSGRGSPR
jgi:hypothetical protein